jgi:hypothetical protein
MQQTNRIEAEVVGAGPGKSDVYLKVNGKTVTIAWGQSAAPGYVGLTIFGHAGLLLISYEAFFKLVPIVLTPIGFVILIKCLFLTEMGSGCTSNQSSLTS